MSLESIKIDNQRIGELLAETKLPVTLRWFSVNGQAAIPNVGKRYDILPASSAMLIERRTEPDYGEYGSEVGLHDGRLGRWYHIKFDHAKPEDWRNQISEAVGALTASDPMEGQEALCSK